MVQEVSNYVAPPRREHRTLVPALESDAGRILLRPNAVGHGFKLRDGAEGLGGGPVDSELVPRLGGRGATLGEQREVESDMFLPIMLRTTTAAEKRRLVAELTGVVRRARGTFRFSVTDPVTGESRFRDLVYRDGLEAPVWESPVSAQFAITADYLDPWAFAPAKTKTLAAVASAYRGGWEVPFQFPLLATGQSVPTAVSVDNTGTEPAPVQVTFLGPSTNPRAWTGSMSVEYRGTLAYDEWVTISGKDFSVRLHGGGRTEPVDVPGRLSPHTLLSELSVPVGRTEWWYEAIDETAQSRAEFTWWSAYQTMYV